MADKLSIARKNLLRKSKEPIGDSVKGYDLNNGVDYEKILDSFIHVGAQATNFGKAIQIIKKMREEKSFIYLGYTSNMITTGIREIIRFLVEHKMVNVLVTSAGGIEEDIIKCLGDFKIGDFKLSGKDLRENSINRAGNILIPNSRYCAFEDFVIPILKEHKNKIKTASDLIWLLGEKINNKESVYYWAWKNKIPVFCPAIMDGSLGDMIYFFKSSNRDFKLDLIEDVENLNNTSIGKEKTGIIILGGGSVKHSICNANMYRDGADYAVYINTGQEFDCSDSGASPDEAVSWGKISTDASSVKIYADATIIFPLLVAKTFAK
jgi:deoxyhypusine synthase